MSEQTTTTHFGFKTVASTEKETLVAGVFHSVAAKYDLMNDLMSFGIHRLWKRFTIDCSGVRKGQKVLDLAGGTGDLTAKFSRIVGETGQVVLADINDSMLKVGRDKLRNLGWPTTSPTYRPMPRRSRSLTTISTSSPLASACATSPTRTRHLPPCSGCSPGGRLLVLEFSAGQRSDRQAVRSLPFKLLPKMGEIVANDSESYKYLAESIRMHPDQQTLAGMMENVGFEQVEFYNLTQGVVALHRGYKF